jgi:hypothetical protein
MPYLPLGSRRQTFAADTSNLNTGFVTAPFTIDVISIHVPVFECHHLTIPSGLPSGTVLNVYLGNQLYSAAQLDTIGDWDPAQPVLMTPGQELYVCLTNVTAAQLAGATVTVTAWFRYDSLFPNN